MFVGSSDKGHVGSKQAGQYHSRHERLWQVGKWAGMIVGRQAGRRQEAIKPGAFLPLSI
jgi:hypothetical protein